MKALDRVIAGLDGHNYQIAVVACGFVDRFKETREPSDLQEAQDFIRFGLHAARSDLRTQKRRKTHRSSLLSARVRRAPSLGPIVGAHIERLQGREKLLERRRKILRGAADALAWIVLANMPSHIPRLFRPQTHDLPDQRGQIGPVAIQQAAHESGRFLVLENDLTRCLGLGDLTAVSRDDPSLFPISIEVKTKAPLIEEGAEMELQLSLVEVDNPRAKAVLEDFESAIGIQSALTERPATAPTKQLEQFFEQSTELVRAHGRRAETLGVIKGNWAALDRVLSRAVPGRPSLDIAEAGVWIGAIACDDSIGNFAADFESLIKTADRLIPRREGPPLSFATTLGLEEHDVAGALALPVAVWSLSRDKRAKILNADLVVVSFSDLAVLSDHLRGHGITLEVDDDEWVVRQGEEEVRLSKAGVARARVDVAFGGLNLESMATRIKELFERER